jgi:poly(A) polymerase
MRQRELPSLKTAAWLNEPRLQNVLKALNAYGETRVVGGAVRNALLGVPVADIDLATVLLPAEVMTVAKAAGFGVHPTGIEHGTVTIAHGGAAFEVTTLRRDVETNGRHAVVEFGQSWQEDAQRRDFTMNALYCDAAGKIYDFTNGYVDIQKRCVKFVGAATQRIQEDYLRILRFFRFHAAYGRHMPDTAGLKACVKLKAGLKTLSAERVRQELFKLLVAPNARNTLMLMAEHRLLKNIIPYTDEWRVFGRLPQDAVLRLFVISKQPETLKDMLRLSNVDAARLQALRAAPDISPALSTVECRRILYHIGASAWRDAVLLSHARSRAAMGNEQWQELLHLADQWTIPILPVKGVDVLSAGIEPGPRVGRILAQLEDWWVANDFAPSRDDLLGRIGRYREKA